MQNVSSSNLSFTPVTRPDDAGCIVREGGEVTHSPVGRLLGHQGGTKPMAEKPEVGYRSWVYIQPGLTSPMVEKPEARY